MTLENRSCLKKMAITGLTVSSFLLISSTGFAEDNSVEIVPAETVNGSVELTPGYITGRVDLGGQNISRIDLEAKSSYHAAKLYPSSEGEYTMTVNVPVGGELGYNVTGLVWMDNWNTKMFLKQRSTVVREAESSTVDFIVDSGYVSGEIITNGCTLGKTEVWAKLETDTAYSNATTKKTPEMPSRYWLGAPPDISGKHPRTAKKIVKTIPKERSEPISWLSS